MAKKIERRFGPVSESAAHAIAESMVDSLPLYAAIMRYLDGQIDPGELLATIENLATSIQFQNEEVCAYIKKRAAGIR